MRRLVFCYLPPVASPAPSAEQLSRDLAHDLPSPYCPGRSIASCSSSAARKLEDEILIAAQEGQTREEIEAGLIARFGREKMGYEQNTAVFIFVTLAALVAIAAVFWAGRRWSKAKGSATAAERPHATTSAAGGEAGAGSSDATEAELDELEDALDELDAL